MLNPQRLSIVIPAFNEEDSLEAVVIRIRDVMREADIEHEIVVVDDGSTDATSRIAQGLGVTLVSHPENLGYGRSLKDGIRASTNELIAITDADGSYPVERIPELVMKAADFDMVVGARQGSVYHGTLTKRLARIVFRRLSEFAAGRTIADINSGLRVFRKTQVTRFFAAISSGFSFTTTVTLVYMLNGLYVHYEPISYEKRQGSSNVRYFRDTLRSLQIIVEAILRYNPIKVFLLLSLPFWVFTVAACATFAFRQDVNSLFIAGCSLFAAMTLLAHGFLAVLLADQLPSHEAVVVSDIRGNCGEPVNDDQHAMPDVLSK